MAAFTRIPPGNEFSVSATLYVTYLKCPQQALARLRGTYPITTKAMFRGSLAHRIFARHLVDGPVPSDTFASVCREETGAHLAGSMASLSLKYSEFTRIVAEVEELYERFKALPAVGLVDVEVDIEAALVEGVTLRGRVDAVFSDDQGVRIVDWKTGSNLDDAEHQLAFYAMAWRLAEGALPTTMEAVSLKTGERRVSAPSDGEADETEADVVAMISHVRTAMASNAELPRSAGPHCQWCPLRGDCAEGRSALEILF